MGTIVLHRDPKINFTRKKPDIFRVSRVWVKYFSGKSGFFKNKIFYFSGKSGSGKIFFGQVGFG
jgi:hypothetical protein